MNAFPNRLSPCAMLVLLAACGGQAPAPAASEPAAPSSEWVQPNPTEPAVPVQLPETPMTNVPAGAGSAQPR